MDLNLPTPNIPLLRKAVEWAEAEAAKSNPQESLWDQTEWAATSMDEPECGTSYCIAGFAVMNSVPGASLGHLDSYGSHALYIGERRANWGDEGQRVLGLTENERHDLFADHNDIEDVRRIAEQIAARVGERL